MDSLLCLLAGYLLGSLSPSALLSRMKGVDIRRTGTGNLGATNAMLNFGKTAGLLVMIFDIAKAFAAFRLAQIFFPELPAAGLLAGCAAVVGHIFPFYLNFRGGKGFASLCGLMLACDPGAFLFALVCGVVLMVSTDISLALQFSVALLFPVVSGIRSGSGAVTILCGAVCALVLVRHRENIAAMLTGKDVKVRDFIRQHFTR